MATTTPNYGWTVPTSTDLVKDGATAIETLGDSVDATVKALNPETTLGDIAYRSSSANVNTRLGIGTTGQILTVAGGLPTWASPASSGAMTLISSNTLSSATSTITFDSIPSTYTHLQLVMQAATGGSDNFINMTFNNVTTSTYYSQFISARAGTVSGEEQLGATSFRVGILNVMYSGIVNIPNYKNTAIKKTANWMAGDRVGTATTNVRTQTGFGTNDATTAITRFDLNCASTFSIGSTFSLYGMS